MKRKIVKLGPATLVVSLPSKWARKFNVKAGDELNLDEQEKDLILKTDKSLKTKREITIEMTDENKQDLEPLLTHSYRRGFDSILIKNIDDKLASKIKTITNDLLLGFEVTTRDRSEIKIENIASPTEQKYDTLLRRSFLIIKETEKIILKDFEKNKFNQFKDIEDLRKQEDKFILFCRRILLKEQPKDLHLQWELLTFLMHIQHVYYYLYKYAADHTIEKEKQLTELLKELSKYFDLFYHAYFNKDIKAIHKINKLKTDYHFGKCLALIEKGTNPVIYAYIKDLFRFIQIGTSPVLARSFDL